MSKTYPIIERVADEVIVTARSTVEASGPPVRQWAATARSLASSGSARASRRLFSTSWSGHRPTLAIPSRRPRAGCRDDIGRGVGVVAAEQFAPVRRRLMDELLNYRPVAAPAAPVMQAMPADASAFDATGEIVLPQPRSPSSPTRSPSPSPSLPEPSPSRHGTGRHRCTPESSPTPT